LTDCFLRRGLPPPFPFSRNLCHSNTASNSAGVQNRNKLAPLFPPGKSKLWRQAATLNRRLYVVGHVARDLNYRVIISKPSSSVSQGNNSSTKVVPLSRDGPVKRDVTHSEDRRFGSLSPVSRRTRPEAISSPLFVGSREDTTGFLLTRTSGQTLPQADVIDF
jgi:hypothetical protein